MQRFGKTSLHNGTTLVFVDSLKKKIYSYKIHKTYENNVKSELDAVTIREKVVFPVDSTGVESLHKTHDDRARNIYY